MGFPMAGHLQQAGHDVSACTTAARKRPQRWVERVRRVRARTSPAAAACGAPSWWPSASGDDERRPRGCKGCSTACCRALERRRTTGRPHHGIGGAGAGAAPHSCAEQRHRLFLMHRSAVGRPVPRTAALTIMVGGDDEDFVRASPFSTAMRAARGCSGDSGAGQLAKMVNQICIAGVVQGLSEALLFSRTGGPGQRRGDRCDQPGCGAVLANGKPLPNHARW
jgi:hypothetical protein